MQGSFAFVLVRRYQHERELNSMSWRIKSEEILFNRPKGGGVSRAGVLQASGMSMYNYYIVVAVVLCIYLCENLSNLS